MAYDSELIDLVRARLSSEPDVTEKRMFGGLAFLVGGHIAVAANSQGSLMLRVAAVRPDELATDPRIETVVMRGKPMPGWVRIAFDGSVGDEELDRWVGNGLAGARSLPAR